jgi:cytochrome P450
MFWLPEIKVAKKAVAKVAETGQGVLDRYRASHTPEEIEADSSIIGHLVRSPYPTELERIADVTIFMLAGHDTTAYQVSWIIIEILKHPQVLVGLFCYVTCMLDLLLMPLAGLHFCV